METFSLPGFCLASTGYVTLRFSLIACAALVHGRVAVLRSAMAIAGLGRTTGTLLLARSFAHRRLR
jgi:hypothetical protein